MINTNDATSITNQDPNSVHKQKLTQSKNIKKKKKLSHYKDNSSVQKCKTTLMVQKNYDQFSWA